MQLIVTSAGRAALVNAEHTGTNTVRIAAIGVGSTGFTAKPDGSDASLPGEIKRLTTFSGQVVAADTLHVTVRDDSSDVYSMRGIALYLDDGTLFALYGQAGVILEKAAQAMMLMSADVVFTQVPASALTFGDANFINPPATTEVQGVVELATDAEAIAGSDAQRAVTPRAAKATLDARLGANAPTAFARNLLAVSTAAALRTALELKGAALKDDGAGKGLDADLLDGRHGDHYLQWSNLVGTPTTFPPGSHAHAWADLQGKPATFPPSAHSHGTAEVTGLDAALAARPVKGSNGTWPDVVPVAADVFEAPAALRSYGAESANRPSDYGVVAAWSNTGKFNKSNGAWISQLAFGGNGRMYASSSLNGSQFGAWDELWSSRNFDPASRVMKAGDTMTGALNAPYLNATYDARFGGGNAVSANKLRIGNIGGNDAYIQCVTNGEAAFAPLYVRGSMVEQRADKTYTQIAPSNYAVRQDGIPGFRFMERSVASGSRLVIEAVSADQSSFTSFVNVGQNYAWLGAGMQTLATLDQTGNLVATKSIFGSSTDFHPTENTDVAALQPSGNYGGGICMRDGIHRAIIYTSNGSSIAARLRNTSTGSHGEVFNATLSGFYAPAFQPYSDERTKTLRGRSERGLNAVLGINAYIGAYKPEFNSDGQERLFLVAQEIEKVAPEIVREDAKGIKTVDLAQMDALLVRAIQELAAEVALLKERR